MPNSKTSGVAKGAEEPVASKAAPDPEKRPDGNTPATRAPKRTAETPESFPKTGKDTSRGPNDHVEATGRDHPSQSEQPEAQSEKRHGTSDRKISDG